VYVRDAAVRTPRGILRRLFLWVVVVVITVLAITVYYCTYVKTRNALVGYTKPLSLEPQQPDSMCDPVDRLFVPMGIDNAQPTGYAPAVALSGDKLLLVLPDFPITGNVEPAEVSIRLFTIGLNDKETHSGASVILNSGAEYAYPKSVPWRAVCGPYIWRQTWFLSVEPNIGLSREDGLLNPIYRFSLADEAAKAWPLPEMDCGVLAFTVGNDLLYVVPALEFYAAQETLAQRSVPTSELLAVTWDGQVTYRTNVAVNFSALRGSPEYLGRQGLDIRTAADEVFVLNRVPCGRTLTVPASSSRGSANSPQPRPFSRLAYADDLAPVPRGFECVDDLIAPPRLDVFDAELNHLRSLELHVSLLSGHYYQMDIDADAGLILLLEAGTGQAWLYNLDLQMLKHYSEWHNFGAGEVLQDFVLRDGLVYVARDDAVIDVYDLGWPEK